MNRTCFNAVALPVLFAASVALGAKVQADKDAAPIPAVGGARVILLAPAIQFELEGSETPLDPEKYKVDALAPKIDRALRSILAARGLTVDEPGAEAYPAPARLVRAGALPDGICAATGAATSGEPVVAFHVRVIVGSRGSWNPSSGAITSSSNRTRLRAALVDCRASRTLWRNEVVLRQLPDPERSGIDKAITQLFGDANARPMEEK